MTQQDNRRSAPSTSGGRARSGRTEEAAFPRAVRSAIIHLRANLHRAVPTAELAAQARVPERTLRDHFHRFLGVSPSSYGLHLRLNAARHELQQPANSDPITRIALRYGFQRLARFAHHYVAAFGERPSATR